MITNTGDTPLQAVTLTDNTILPGNIVISPAIGTLAAGASTAPGQVTATYQLTQDDLNASQLVNTASVSANAGTGLDVSDTDSATVTGLADPGLSVVKTVASSTVTNPSLAGQTIRYSFVVSNTGNVTLENLVLSDVLPGIVPDPAGAFTIGTLAPEGEPGDSTTVYATYTITQDDIDAGIVENQASVDGTWGPSGTPIDADSLQVDVPLYKAPSLRVVKLSDSASVPAVPVEGDTITWTVTITNTGNTRLTLTNIDEPMAGATVTAPTPSTLEPLGVATATVSYNLTQTNIDAGGVVNQVTVSSEIPGQPDVVPDQPSGDDATTPNTDPTETPLNREPSLTLVKTLVSTPSNPAVLNEVLDYTFEIRNTGNVTLTNITLDDLLPGAAIDTGDLSWLAMLSLPPDATAVVSVPGTYTVTQADIEAGHVTNRAIATGTAPDSRVVDDESGTDVNNDDPTVATLGQNPGIALVKTIATAPAEPMKEGDIVTYSFAVSNTGNVELRDIAITDAVAGVTVQGTRGTPLLPGETDNTSFTATYALTEADIVARNFINTATATGTGNRGGVPVQVSNTDDEELLIGPNPRLEIVKSADDTALQAPPQPGDIITYSFVISNTGNLDLTDVTLTDPLPGLTLPVTVVASLPAHQSVTLTGSYAITAGDLTNGLIDNQASVTGDYVDPGTNTPGTLPPVPSNPVQVPLDRVPGISLVKTADATAVQSPARPGDQISYAFTVSNTGNVDLRDVVVADPLPGLTPGSFTIASLPIGATVTVQPALYALTQADIDAGKVENRAKATGTWGTPADPQQVEDDSVTDAGVDGPTVTTLDVAPAIALVKTVDPAINIAALRAGSQLRWTFEVTNTGNVTLTGVTISESLAGVTVTGGPVTLAPGAVDRTSFTAAYTITQADLDQGFIRNSATVTGTHDDGTNPPVEVTDVSGGTVSDDNPTVTPLTQKPGIALIKTADVTALSDPAKAGDTIRYAFTVTNTGDVTLTNVTVTDALPGITLSGNPIASLAPGAVNSTAITAAYVLTQADIDAGRVENTALVTGSWTDGSTGQPGTVTDTSGTDNGTDTPTVVEIEPVPGLELLKTADASAISVPAVAGEPITYHFAITNTGNVTMTNVVIDDPMPGLVLSGQPIASLAPGETSTAISGIYPITAADIVATEITNTAKAGGEWSKGSVSSHTDSNNSTVEVPLGYPEIAFSITVGELRDLNGDGIMGPGDEVVFRFEVTNTGTVPLNGVDLDYSSLSLLMPGLVCTPITLAVGESAFLECVGTAYRITEDDAARGEIVLTGTAQGTSDAGVVVTDASTAPAVTGLAMGGLTITKLAGVETAMVGDLVPYTIRISNGAEGVPVTTRVVDTLPAGFIYREGSAQLDGVAVTPAISGRTLVIEPVTVNPGQTRVLTMSVLVGSSVRPGAHTNVARLVNPGTGIDIAEEASATVRVLADAVMQCATVLGRVFDDTDQNGHMSKAAEERGLPNVRLVAPNGLAITTDEHGRFNVPCAALPQAIGSNFMLKLDERTLPSGYRLTTENPRVVRLTPGMITRLDFGATMARLVRIDLAANAFTDGGLSPALEAGLKKMVAKISDQATMLRISYVLASGEDAGNAKARLRLVEKTLRNLWRGTGTYKLNIETVIERAGVEQ